MMIIVPSPGTVTPGRRRRPPPVTVTMDGATVTRDVGPGAGASDWPPWPRPRPAAAGNSG